MSVDTTNLIQGPAVLYAAVFGATEPADVNVSVAPSGAAWRDLGGTKDGVNLTVEQEFSELEIDQIIDVPDQRRTKRIVKIATSLAEPTLDNLALALNGGTVTPESGYSTFDPDDSSAATQPVFKAVLLDGFAPNGRRRRVIVRKVLNVSAVGAMYKKDEQNVFPVEFMAHYVSPSIRPFRVIDEVAA